MITYTTPWPSMPHIQVPKLHRVTYDRKYTWQEVNYWCNNHCRASFYTAPSWAGTFIEFEDNTDASMFALKFS